MRPTTITIRNQTDLLDMVVACAPVDWPMPMIQGAVLGILNRAVYNAVSYGSDWGRIWPESDGEWLGVLEEQFAAFGNRDFDPRRSIVKPAAELVALPRATATLPKSIRR